MLNNIFGNSNEELLEKFSKLEERISKLETTNVDLVDKVKVLELENKELKNYVHVNSEIAEDLSESIEIIKLILGNRRRSERGNNADMCSFASLTHCLVQSFNKPENTKIRHLLMKNVETMKKKANDDWKKISDNMDKIRSIEFNFKIAEILEKK